MTCKFKTLDELHANLEESISTKSDDLPLDIDFYELLPEYDDFTTLSLTDGNAIEVVKVTNLCGKIVIDRGVEGTRPQAFPCGTNVDFIITRLGVESLACCMECE